MDQLLTVAEAASMLACSQAAIRKWLYQRRLPSVKVGRPQDPSATVVACQVTSCNRPARRELVGVGDHFFAPHARSPGPSSWRQCCLVAAAAQSRSAITAIIKTGGTYP